MTSIHITFIAKFGINAVHNNVLVFVIQEILMKYLKDLIEPVNTQSKQLDAYKTSVLTLINRYIILFK